ncbi:RNA binding protein, heterogenous nuclear RNP-K like protein [Coemansia sp. RSA 988]|nr:RNA binding protein, heterogenous nuclear RNP-K like protein [Coemansia sp. RSA 988]
MNGALGTSAGFRDGGMGVICDKDNPDYIHLGSDTMSNVGSGRDYNDHIDEQHMYGAKEQWDLLPRPDTPVASTPPMTAVDYENDVFDEPDSQKVMLRLIFSHEDGGMLIGKNGRHITKLKESTSASWFITGNSPSNVDRIVVIRGTADEVSHKKRNELGITWLHAHQDSIPFTQERILEVSGPAAALKEAVAWLLCTTISDLAIQQQTSTLYMPTRNGLQQMLQKERRPGTSDQASTYKVSAGESDSSYTHTGRKRSSSAFGTNTYRPASGDAHWPARNKRPRHASDSTNGRGRGTNHCECPTNPRRRSSPLLLSSPSSNSEIKRDRDTRTEKLVIPDTIAGPLIGRNGSNLESLKERSGASIAISPRTHNMPDRIVTVTGKLKEVNCACKLIKSFMRSFDKPSP